MYLHSDYLYNNILQDIFKHINYYQNIMKNYNILFPFTCILKDCYFINKNIYNFMVRYLFLNILKDNYQDFQEHYLDYA